MRDFILLYVLVILVAAGTPTLVLILTSEDCEGERDIRREAARKVLLSPVWPVLAVIGAVRLWKIAARREGE